MNYEYILPWKDICSYFRDSIYDNVTIYSPDNKLKITFCDVKSHHKTKCIEMYILEHTKFFWWNKIIEHNVFKVSLHYEYHSMDLNNHESCFIPPECRRYIPIIQDFFHYAFDNLRNGYTSSSKMDELFSSLVNNSENVDKIKTLT